MGLKVHAAFAGIPPVELLMVVHVVGLVLKFSLNAETFDSTPPDAVTCVARPHRQIDAMEGETVTAEGKGRTITFTVVLFAQPLFGPPEASVAVTVYVVFTTGFAPTVAPTNDPGVHRYV